MPAGIGYGGGGALGSPDAAGVGMPEPSAIPGAVGDIDSLLRQITSGQMSAESILPLLFMLMMGGPGGQGGPAPIGPPQGGPIDQAFAEGQGPALPPPPEQGGGEIPPDMLAMLGGGGLG